MRHFLLLLLIIVSSQTSELCAQRRKNTPKHEHSTWVERRAQYDFTGALRILQKSLKGKLTPELRDSLLKAQQEMQLAQQLLPSTARLVFVDSVVVRKTSLLSILTFGEETGTYLPTTRLFSEEHNTAPTQKGDVAYVNPLQNAAYFSLARDSSGLKLHAAYRSNDQWSTPTPLQGIDSSFINHDFPFVMPDGITLYFGAKGANSMGGYDIFATRYNADTRQFVRPANLGMPYNSPANDYLYAVDHAAGLGYLVTDRRQAEDSVCIYSFLYKKERSLYPDSTTTEQLTSAAQIRSIADSQKSAPDELLNWQSLSLNAPHAPQTEASFRFVVDDRRVYTTLAHFHNPQARQWAKQWAETQNILQTCLTRHANLQRDYAEYRSARTAQSLRLLELQIAELQQRQKQLAKQIRQAELPEL